MEAHDTKELIALINYMIHHNEHHNGELEELASTLKGVNEAAYKKVKDAISDFEKGNAALGEAFKELSK